MGSNYILNTYNLQEVLRVLKHKRQKNRPQSLTPEPAAVEKVKRALFGTPSREETEAFIDREWNNAQRIQQERWNFDFVRGIPITGPKTRICWEMNQEAADTFAEKPEESSEKKLAVAAATSAAGEAPTPILKQRQTKMTHFMNKRRRPCEEAEDAPARKSSRPADPQDADSQDAVVPQ